MLPESKHACSANRMIQNQHVYLCGVSFRNMVDTPTKVEQLLSLARERGVVRASDLDEAAIPRAYLGRLVGRGLLIRTGPCTYTHPDADLTEHHTLAEVARRAPAAVICLLSALRYHQLTSQNPSEVWVTLPRNAWRPAAVGSAPLRVFTASPALYGTDVEEHLVEGVHVRVYSAVRTVADCFRHRSAVGLDVALEALRDLLRRQPSCRDALWRCACRVRIGSVLRPYLEALS